MSSFVWYYKCFHWKMDDRLIEAEDVTTRPRCFDNCSDDNVNRRVMSHLGFLLGYLDVNLRPTFEMSLGQHVYFSLHAWPDLWWSIGGSHHPSCILITTPGAEAQLVLFMSFSGFKRPSPFGEHRGSGVPQERSTRAYPTRGRGDSFMCILSF